MTLTLTATAEPAQPNQPPRIRLDIVGTAPTSPSSRYTLLRLDADGRSRPVVGVLNAALTTGTATAYDYHAPFNSPVGYSVTAGTVTTTAPPVTIASSDSWLIHRTNPNLSVKIDNIIEIAQRSYQSTSALHWVFGAEFPVAKNEGVRRARAGQLTIAAESKANHDALVAALADSGPILINFASPPNDQVTWWDETWAWIQPDAYTTSNPAGGWIYYQYRHLNFSYQVVDTPVAASVPLWSWSDVATTFATWADFSAAYATWSGAAIDYRAT